MIRLPYFMRGWLFAATLAAAAVASSPVMAAEVTNVVDSFEDEDEFDIEADFRYVFSRKSGLITHETVQDGRPKNAKALNNKITGHAIELDFNVGVFHDLAIHFNLPVYQSRSQATTWADGVNKDNSTLVNNTGRDPLTLDLVQRPVILEDRFESPDTGAIRASRGGFGDMTVGLRWSPFNDERDDTSATLTLAFDWSIPTGGVPDPADVQKPGTKGKVGKGYHAFLFTLASSKRMDPPGWPIAFDPYTGLTILLPKPTTAGENIDLDPPIETSAFVGNELIVYEHDELHSKLAIDLRAFANWTSWGATYSEVSDLVGRITQVQEYATIGGKLGIIGRFNPDTKNKKETAPRIKTGLEMTLAGQTAHLLTVRDVGTDLNDNGLVDLNSNERDPLFDDFATVKETGRKGTGTDIVGRRLGVRGVVMFNLMFVAGGSF